MERTSFKWPVTAVSFITAWGCSAWGTGPKHQVKLKGEIRSELRLCADRKSVRVVNHTPRALHRSVHGRIVRTDKDRELTGWLCQLNTVMPTNQRDLLTKHQRTRGFSSVTEVVIAHLCLWISHQRHQAQVHWLIIDKSWKSWMETRWSSQTCGCVETPPPHRVG